MKEVAKSGIIQRASRYIGYGLKPMDVAVIDVTERLGDDHNNYAPAPLTARDETPDIDPHDIENLI